MTFGAVFRNQYGAVVVDSDHRHTVFYDKRTPQIVDVGSEDARMAFGWVKELGYLSSKFYPTPDFLHWIRIPAGAWCFPGAWMFKPGQVEILRTSRTQPLQKGMLNVYDGGGNLVWSDVSSYNMPRIRGFIKPTLGIDNNVEGISPGFNPWFLLNNCPGNMSDDGFVLGFSGLSFRWDGNTLFYKWEIQNQSSTFTNVFGSREILKIPYAFFNYGR